MRSHLRAKIYSTYSALKRENSAKRNVYTYECFHEIKGINHLFFKSLRRPLRFEKYSKNCEAPLVASTAQRKKMNNEFCIYRVLEGGCGNPIITSKKIP